VTDAHRCHRVTKGKLVHCLQESFIRHDQQHVTVKWQFIGMS